MEIRDTVLPVLRPTATSIDIAELTETLESGWWGKGPKVERFEREFAEMVGAKHALAVTSNTHGLDLVIKAMGIRDADIINPSISFMTTAMVPLWNGCSSNIVDVRPDNLCIDPDDVKRSLKPNTAAVIAVNHAGVAADIDGIREFYEGPVIEDCAHSCYTPGAGSKGDVAIWSFQAVKTMPTGDGGMITLDDSELYEKLIPMTWLGITSTYSRTKAVTNSPTGRPGYSWDYEVEEVGYKAYMTDLTASLGLSQMRQLPGNLSWRRHIQARYNAELSEGVERPQWSETVQYYCARVESELRDDLMSFLADKKIHTSVHFKPLYKYEIMKQDRRYPVSEEQWTRLISLPCHSGMTDEDISYVVFWVNNFFSSR
jgi:perosamine synthetase